MQSTGSRLSGRLTWSLLNRAAPRLPLSTLTARTPLLRRPCGSAAPPTQPVRALCVPSSPGSAAPLGEMSEASPVFGAKPTAFLAWEGPIYARFVNMIMKDGKKETARKLLWQTFVRLREGGHDPQDVFYSALDNVRPMIEMRSFKQGPVPFPLNPRRAEGKAMKWIVGAARKRSGTSFDRRLAQELLAAQQHKGAAYGKREEVHKTAVANQAAAHFRWRIGGSRPVGAIDMERKLYRPRGRRMIKRLQ